MEVGKPSAATDGMKQEFGVIRASLDAPFFTTIAGMSPSPDWFTGFSMLDLRQNTDDPNMPQQWYREFQVETYALTAGTRSGETYMEAGTDLDPKVPIRPLYTAESGLSTGVLLDANKDEAPPVVQWSCNLVNAVEFALDNTPNDEDVPTDVPGVVESGMEALGNSTMGNSTLGNSTLGESQAQNEGELLDCCRDRKWADFLGRIRCADPDGDAVNCCRVCLKSELANLTSTEPTIPAEEEEEVAVQRGFPFRRRKA